MSITSCERLQLSLVILDWTRVLKVTDNTTWVCCEIYLLIQIPGCTETWGWKLTEFQSPGCMKSTAFIHNGFFGDSWCPAFLRRQTGLAFINHITIWNLHDVYVHIYISIYIYIHTHTHINGFILFLKLLAGDEIQ